MLVKCQMEVVNDIKDNHLRINVIGIDVSVNYLIFCAIQSSMETYFFIYLIVHTLHFLNRLHKY